MEIRVDGRILLVTGGTQGVGRAIALAAAEAGAEGIVISGRKLDQGEAAVAEIEARGARAHFVAADLAGPETPAALFSAAIAHFGRVDALVNAGADTNRGGVADASPDFFDRIFTVNTKAPMFLMQALIRHLRERKAPGAIVNILSINIHGGTPELAVYAASKAALELLTRNAAYSHRFDRIRVNGINLGWADTPGERQMQAVTLGKGESWLAEAEASQPWGRLLKPDDAARLALFLLSDVSIPMTGATIDQEQQIITGMRG